MEFWFRQKYNLPPTDPRFLDATIEEMLIDHWACHYKANPAAEEVEDEEFDQEAILRQMEENPDGWEEVILGEPGNQGRG